MASNTFNTALLLTPLASTTASLLLAWDHHLFISPFTRAPNTKHGEAILPGYWRAIFPRGLPQVLGLLAATTLSTGAAVWRHADVLRQRGSLACVADRGDDERRLAGGEEKGQDVEC
ncbi:hypothetical protein K4F52_003936 [Lecanicillium sp. MT-2017a]|nr:hypothetical protein K4F52_003936 [Lecanicillium sp. MT-2017a]